MKYRKRRLSSIGKGISKIVKLHIKSKTRALLPLSLGLKATMIVSVNILKLKILSELGLLERFIFITRAA